MGLALDTKERILDAAEKLFAAEGLSRTSLRAITLEAGVNVAAVHYHFGSKEVLLEAVLARRVAPMNSERVAELERIEAQARPAPPAIEAILTAFIAPAFRLQERLPSDGPTLTQLFGRLYAEPEEVVERLVREHFGDVARRFIEALCRALPHLPQAEVWLRFQFAIGVLGHILCGHHRMDVIPGHPPQAEDEEQTVRHIVSFLAAGFRAAQEFPR